MIFVTVGSQLPFDRLIGAMDNLAPTLGVPVFAQVGRSQLRPRSMEYADVLSPAEFEARMHGADVVVAHAGIGTVLQARAFRKRLVVMPRRAALGEHRNDHQLATAKELLAVEGVCVANGPEELEQILRARQQAPSALVKSPQHLRLIQAVRALVG